MKRFVFLFLLTISLTAVDHKKVPDIYVHEESVGYEPGERDRIATGKTDCATAENFEQLMENGQYDLCRAYLAGKKPAEITALKLFLPRKPGKVLTKQEEIEAVQKRSKKIDQIMGELWGLPSGEEVNLADDEKDFLKGVCARFPLHHRAFFGDKGAVNWFLKHYPGYDVSTTTVTGYTASDVACHEGYVSLANELKALTSRPKKQGTFSRPKKRLLWIFLFLFNCHLLYASQA